MSMVVEKSTADDVRKKFDELKKSKDEPAPVDSVLDGMLLETWQLHLLPLLLCMMSSAEHKRWQAELADLLNQNTKSHCITQHYLTCRVCIGKFCSYLQGLTEKFLKLRKRRRKRGNTRKTARESDE